jgi:hypothetical protein
MPSLSPLEGAGSLCMNRHAWSRASPTRTHPSYSYGKSSAGTSLGSWKTKTFLPTRVWYLRFPLPTSLCARSTPNKERKAYHVPSIALNLCRFWRTVLHPGELIFIHAVPTCPEARGESVVKDHSIVAVEYSPSKKLAHVSATQNEGFAR